MYYNIHVSLLSVQAAGPMCDNVVTSLQITVLYSYTNNFDSPEAVLSGVEYSYNTDSVVSSHNLYQGAIPLTVHTHTHTHPSLMTGDQ